MNQESYVYFGEILQEKIRYFEQTGQGLGFSTAVLRLIEREAVHTASPEIPDFLSWNLTTYTGLRRRIEKIPVPLRDVQEVRTIVQDSTRHLSVYNRVQISAEACYAEEELQAVDYFSMTYVLEGSCRLRLKGQERRLRVGELVILPPQIPHAFDTTPDDLAINIISAREHFEENFSRILYRDNLVSTFFRRSLFSGARDPLYFSLQPTKDVRSLIQHLFAEFLRRDYYSELLFNNYLQIFYTNIIRCCEQPKEEAGRSPLPAILSEINRNYHTLSLETLSAQFHYESTYLSRLIHQTTGKRYSEIVTELKIKEAEELLQTTSLSMEEIAQLVGYSTAEHFGYMFKKLTGMSPRTWRKNNRVG